MPTTTLCLIDSASTTHSPKVDIVFTPSSCHVHFAFPLVSCKSVATMLATHFNVRLPLLHVPLAPTMVCYREHTRVSLRVMVVAVSFPISRSYGRSCAFGLVTLPFGITRTTVVRIWRPNALYFTRFALGPAVHNTVFVTKVVTKRTTSILTLVKHTHLPRLSTIHCLEMNPTVTTSVLDRITRQTITIFVIRPITFHVNALFPHITSLKQTVFVIMFFSMDIETVVTSIHFWELEPLSIIRNQSSKYVPCN